MIKVLQVVSDTNIGGAGRYLLNYLKYYDRESFLVYVVVPKGSKLVPRIEKYEEVQLIEAPFMADKSYDRKCVSFLKKLFLEIKPDIVHTHASLSARIAARAAKTPKIISTRHCLEPVSSGIKAKAMGIINSFLTDVYVAVSDSVAENLKNSGVIAEKIKTVYNGVEKVEEIPLKRIQEIKNEFNISDDEIVFGIFARLEAVKGHKYFLKAAREFVKTGRKAKFIAAGEGSLREDLHKRAENYGILNNVIFTGFVEDTTELLNVVDVNVISSESEAMSLAILEAMSLSKPTIATDAGGNSQLVQTSKTGILVGVADTISLSQAMMKIADDKELYFECSKGAKELYEKSFSADIMVYNLENLYKEIVKK